MHDIQYLSYSSVANTHVLLRVDYNLSLRKDNTIADDTRMKQTLPTIQWLLDHHNKIILLSHLGRPKGIDPLLSLHQIAKRLQTYLPGVDITFVTDPLNSLLMKQAIAESDIVFVENIRFFPGEDKNDAQFAASLAHFGTTYVNDAFSVSHRDSASVIGLPRLLPSYAGLLFEKEVHSLTKLIDHPEKPFVAILGGAKISTKLPLILKLTSIADHVLLGGGLANTLLLAEGKEVGTSLVEKDAVGAVHDLVTLAESKQTELVLPTDVIVGTMDNQNTFSTKTITAVTSSDQILDIGPATQEVYKTYIATAKTLVWNGPVGYFENPAFAKGTDVLFEAIAQNPDAFSVIGGGETLTAVKQEKHLENISHISTAGGAMLEFIEKGTLPGIEALRESPLSGAAY